MAPRVSEKPCEIMCGELPRPSPFPHHSIPQRRDAEEGECSQKKEQWKYHRHDDIPYEMDTEAHPDRLVLDAIVPSQDAHG